MYFRMRRIYLAALHYARFSRFEEFWNETGMYFEIRRVRATTRDLGRTDRKNVKK